MDFSQGPSSVASTLPRGLGGQLDAKVERAPRVQDAINQHMQTVAQAHQSLSMLEDRLLPVLAPDPPSSGAAGKTPDSPYLMDGINVCQIGVNELIARIERLTRRLVI